jgi:hypothetical protein
MRAISRSTMDAKGNVGRKWRVPEQREPRSHTLHLRSHSRLAPYLVLFLVCRDVVQRATSSGIIEPNMDCCDHCHASDPHRGHPGYRRAQTAVIGAWVAHAGAKVALAAAESEVRAASVALEGVQKEAQAITLI